MSGGMHRVTSYRTAKKTKKELKQDLGYKGLARRKTLDMVSDAVYDGSISKEQALDILQKRMFWPEKALRWAIEKATLNSSARKEAEEEVNEAWAKIQEARKRSGEMTAPAKEEDLEKVFEKIKEEAKKRKG